MWRSTCNATPPGACVKSCDRLQAAQAGLQLLAVPSAQTKRGSIPEQHIVFAILVEFQTAYAIELNDGRTVNPAEYRLIEVLLKLRHAAPQQVRLRSHVQTGVIIRRLDPIDLQYLYKRHLSGALHRQQLPASRR